MLAGAAAAPPRSLAWQRFAFGVAGFIVVWLPIQTTLIAALYQYAGIPATLARALLLGKDVVVAASVVLLAIAYRRSVGLRWFDFVAAAYVALVLVYAFVPMLAGSGLPLEAVAASIRAFVLPVELYALGRLVKVAGVSIERVVSLFVFVSAIAAVAMLLQYALTSPSFWVETIDLVGFVREVQGLPGAVDLWSISALGHFGVGEIATFARAVGPFAHPVGTAHYFLLPLILTAAIGVTSVNRRPGWARRPAVVIALVVLFALAVITPISRGAWIATAVAAVVVGVLSGRLLRVILGLAIATAFVALVPPFNYSILSLLNLSDSSALGHLDAIQRGVGVIAENPLGLGAGHGDHLGEALSGAPGGVANESAGVGESMYLAILATAGPLGLVALLVWLAAIVARLLPTPPLRPTWYQVGLLGGFLGLLVSSTIASPLMRFTTSAGLWLLIGMAVHEAGAPGTVPQAITSIRRLFARLRPGGVSASDQSLAPEE